MSVWSVSNGIGRVHSGKCRYGVVCGVYRVCVELYECVECVEY
jgi:hypothetical protein